MEHFVGIYYVLTHFHESTIYLGLIAATVVPVFLLRVHCEGQGYQEAFSAQIGLMVLLGVVLIGAEVLTSESAVQIPSWFRHEYVQVVFIGLLVGGSYVFHVAGVRNQSRSAQWGDTWFDIVIFPLVMFLVITVVPLVAFNGDSIQIATMVLCGLVYWVTLRYDQATGRLDQRAFLETRGTFLKDRREDEIAYRRRRIQAVEQWLEKERRYVGVPDTEWEFAQ